MLFGGVKQVVKVEGMHCVHCAAHVKEALEKLDGVKKVDVSLEKKEAVVKSKNGIDEEAAKKLIEEAGFVYCGLEK